jgi:hypothetical protein
MTASRHESVYGADGNLHVLCNEVGVDGYGSCWPFAGRGDDLGSRIGHIVRHPHAGNNGLPAAVLGGPSVSIDSAAQADERSLSGMN